MWLSNMGVGGRKKRCREGENGGNEMGGVWSCGEVVEEKWVRGSGKKNESQKWRKNGKRRGQQRVWGREVVFSRVWEVGEEEKWRKSGEKNGKRKKIKIKNKREDGGRWYQELGRYGMRENGEQVEWLGKVERESRDE